jgi:apolipoprotein N-acyltransferase
MDSKPGSLPPAWVAVALALAAVALYHGSGLEPHWWLTWLAPIPLFFLSTRLRWWQAGVAALAAWLLGSLNMWHYYHAVVQMPLGETLMIVVAPALLCAADVLLFRQRLLRGHPAQAVLLATTLWVSCEYLAEVRSPYSTFGNLAYSQMSFPPILQIASLTGIWGISFCLFLFATSVAALGSSASAGRRRPLAVGVAVFLGAVLAYGSVRLCATPASPQVNIGLVASDLPQNLAPREEHALPVFAQYAAQVDALARAGAQVVIIPEKAAVLGPGPLQAFDRILRDAASRNHVYVLSGVLRTPGTYNEIRVYAPDGTLAATYDKHHMLSPDESDEIPGTTRTLLHQPSGTWGLTICKDMDFPGLSRAYGNDGTGLLLVPASDFVDDGWLHGRMAILRGVESGFSIARSVKQGILTVSDNRGRVLAEQVTGEAPFATLLAAVPVHHEATLYARLGDWFAWVNLGLLVVSVTYRARDRRRSDPRR